MLFTYWTNAEVEIPASAPAWQKIYSEFRVFTDEDVLSLLPPSFRPLYQKIRLPAAKSDLARLLLLRSYGGLYVDAHIGPASPAHLFETVEGLSAYNLILFGKGWEMKTETDFNLMNGVIAARKGSPELAIVINHIIENIKEQRAKESQTPEYVRYGLFGLTGTYTLVRSFFNQLPPRPCLKEQFQDKILVHYMKDNLCSGLALRAFDTYRKHGNHWSERQKQERFFID